MRNAILVSCQKSRMDNLRNINGDIVCCSIEDIYRYDISEQAGKVSKAMGLWENGFPQKMKSVPKDILRHSGLKGLLLIYIENVFYDIEKQHLKEKLSEELLKQVGFTDSKVRDTLMKRSKKMAQHLEPLDFIKRFVKDEFKYNPILAKQVQECNDEIPDKENLPFQSNYRKDEHCKGRFFHGTDQYSANDIRTNGIELDFGRHKHDFSDGGGFYLTKSFEHAKAWACSQTRKPMVVELKIPQICLEKACALALDVSEKKGRSDWDRVVKENRSGRPSEDLRQELKKYDCITGPISMPSQNCAGSNKRVPESDGSHQLCILTRSFADEIERYAECTLHDAWQHEE